MVAYRASELLVIVVIAFVLHKTTDTVHAWHCVREIPALLDYLICGAEADAPSSAEARVVPLMIQLAHPEGVLFSAPNREGAEEESGEDDSSDGGGRAWGEGDEWGEWGAWEGWDGWEALQEDEGWETCEEDDMREAQGGWMEGEGSAEGHVLAAREEGEAGEDEEREGTEGEEALQVPPPALLPETGRNEEGGRGKSAGRMVEHARKGAEHIVSARAVVSREWPAESAHKRVSSVHIRLFVNIYHALKACCLP